MKKVIIVGATSGIGKNLAKIFAENNCKVGIMGRREENLKKIKAENKESYYVETIDITDIQNVESKLEKLKYTLGGVDILIISSGIGDFNNDLDFSIEENTIKTNVLGFTCVADWAFNFFKEQGHGHLIGISSIAGLRGNDLAPAYNATKSFQINYLEGLQQKAEKLKEKILVSDIRPGFVKTAMAKGEKQFWVAPVEKASLQIYKAIMKKKKVVYVTKRWKLIAIILKLLPRL